MMKRVALVFVLSALTSMIGCRKEAGKETPADNDILYVDATVEATLLESKVSLDGKTPVWNAGDRIGIFTSDGQLCPAFTAGEGGASSTTFSGQKPSGSVLATAFYPYDSGATVSGGSITLTLPHEQSGSAADAIMVAAGSQEGGFVFHNVCCLVKFSVPSSLNVRKVEILSDGHLSGSFSVNTNSFAVSAGSPSSSSDKSVVLSSSSALSGEYVLAVVPGTGKRLQMAFTRGDGKIALVNKDFGTGKPFAAGVIKDIGTVPASLEFFDAAQVGNPVTSQMSQTLTVLPESTPQITNGNFETWTLDGDNLPNNWNSFQTFEIGGSWFEQLTLKLGYDSKNRQVAKSTDKRPGSSGSYSCRIWSRSVASIATAQGNLTTGRVYASNTSAAGTGNYNYTDQDGSITINNKSNPFHMNFTGRPDSLVVWIKFNQPEGTDSNHPYSKVEAILHDNVDYKSGYNASDCTGGTHHIGEASINNITKTNGAWKRFALPFKYNYSTTPSFILINIATNSYPGGGKKNDEMFIDDIEMIYNRYCRLSIPSQGWATMYVDFKVKVPAGAQVYYVTEFVNGYASLKQIPAGSVIPAGTAVIVKSSSSSVTFEPGTGTPVSISGNILKGTLSAKTCQSGKCYVLSSASTSSTPVFALYNGTSIKANTAYIEP